MGSNRAAEATGSPPCGEKRSSSRRCQPNPSITPVNRWAAVCEDLTTVLRNWPIGDIERGVRLSEPQRVAFYELVTASLRAADTLSSACPSETALTPLGRMVTLRARLGAVRVTASSIRPALTRFYNALDQEQKLRFAGMN